MKVSKRQLARIIREEKARLQRRRTPRVIRLNESQLRQLIRRERVLLEKKKGKKGKKNVNITKNAPWNWWAVVQQEPNQFGSNMFTPSAGASQPLFGGAEPMPEAEWNRWFVAPESEGLGHAGEQYEQYMEIWDDVSSDIIDRGEEEEAMRDTPEEREQRRKYSPYE